MGLVINVLNRDFAPQAPTKVWVTDIPYIRTYEGWLFLAAAMDLSSRQIVGWATAPTMTSDLVLQALVAAAWRRKPGPCQRNSDNPKTRIFAPRTSTIAHHDLTP